MADRLEDAPSARPPTGGEVAGHFWDVVIVGAGMGGGIAARRLAEGGASVLVVDAGPTLPRDHAQMWLDDVEDPATRAEHGFWPGPMIGTIDGREMRSYGSVGTGVGGTSLFYAAMLERPARHEIEPVPGLPHPTGGWPIGYDTLAPYYADAEAMLSVCGGKDPLDPDAPAPGPFPPQSAGDLATIESLTKAGLHPYRKHVAVRYLPGCEECFGRTCPRACKMDGRSAGIEPALATGRVALLDRCEVTALRGSARRIETVDAIRGGEKLTLRGRIVLLAAGALGSPRLLLASASETWPNGCANRSDLVGRNLMFHLNERFAVWPEHRADFTGFVSAISLRDFYARDGVRYGHVHTMGLEATYGNVLGVMRQEFDRSPLARLKPLRHALRIPAFAAAKLFGNARIWVGLLEDMPELHNRVLLDRTDSRTIRFTYRLTDELQARRRAFRAMIRQGFGRRFFFLHQEPEINTAHACGTLRFGTQPGTSVLDPTCRAHDIDNLYVTDASFMPTSNGVNPSLTIAANALRVSDVVLAELAGDSAVRAHGGR